MKKLIALGSASVTLVALDPSILATAAHVAMASWS